MQAEPEDDIQYDLAGNPLPPKPKAAVPPGLHFAAPPLGTPAFTPPPGSFTPPPGAASYTPPKAPQKAASGANLYFGLGVGLLALIGLIFGIGALKPKLAAAPTVYKTYTAIDNSFSCDQPGGWTLHETGATSGSLATASFQDGPARVRVISDAIGSLLGDMQTAGNANLPQAMQIPAVQKLHTMDEKQLADSLPDYKEGDMQTFQSAAGDSRVSEWTAGGSLHGYRVTMLGRDRELTVICFCPERSWPVLKPAFLRMINSVKPGTGS